MTRQGLCKAIKERYTPGADHSTSTRRTVGLVQVELTPKEVNLKSERLLPSPGTMIIPVFLLGLASSTRLFVVTSANHLPPSDLQENLINESVVDESTEDRHSSHVQSDQDANKDTKLNDWQLFQAFINASTQPDDNQPPPAVFTRSRPHHHHHHGHHHHHHDHGHHTNDQAQQEQHVSSKDARDFLFRGMDPGRPVPLNVSQLMPDKCLMYGFEQIVSYPGCQNTTVRNHMCYGLCSSLFVPMDGDFIYSCTACLPTEFRSVAVELECPGSITGDKLRMHVRVVRACSCLMCSSQHMNR